MTVVTVDSSDSNEISDSSYSSDSNKEENQLWWKLFMIKKNYDLYLYIYIHQ